MKEVKHKIDVLRMFYAADRYAPSPLERERLHKIVVEGREQQFFPLIGINSQSTWSRLINDQEKFSEARLKRIAQFFHLDEIAEEGWEGWHLLTERMAHREFAAHLVAMGYGTLASVQTKLTMPAKSPNRTDFLRSLLSMPAGDLTIDVIVSAAERGAAERYELEELKLLHRLQPWTPYSYEVSGDPTLSGDLYILEVSSAIGGGNASCTMVAPSKLHTRPFFTNPTIAPPPRPGKEPISFRMSDKDARCTTIAFVTPKPLHDLPEPRLDNFFAKISIENVYLLSAQLAEMGPSVFRGICTLGLRT